METIVKADIFFFVTTVVVVILSIVAGVLLYYCIRLVKALMDISEVVRDEAKLIKSDIDTARGAIKAKAEIVGSIISAIVPRSKPARGKRKEGDASN